MNSADLPMAVRVRVLQRLRRRRRSWTPHDRRAWQAKALQHLEARAARTRFHAEQRERTTRRDLVDSFDDLVVDQRITKAEVEEALATRDNAEPARSRYRVAATTGSSGQPAVLAFDEREWAAMVARSAAARALAGPLPENARRAVVASTSRRHISVQVASTLHDRRRPSLRLGAAEPLDELLGRLRDWRPNVLTGYPSILATIARAQADAKDPLRVERVQTSGEYLSPATRQLLAEAFGAEVFDSFGTTEGAIIAGECRAHDGLHIDDDVLLVPEGAASLLTVLTSRLVPLIRYQLDDDLQVTTDQCACGSHAPRIVAISGRDRETLSLDGVAGRPVSVHPHLFHNVLNGAPVLGWRVLHRRDRVRVMLTGADDQAIEAVRAGVTAELQRLDVAVEVDVVDVPELPRLSSGKASLVAPESTSPT